LNWIADSTKNYCDDILHASHHGSISGADLDFIKKAKAAETIISTKSGVKENVPHATALKRYTEHTTGRVFRTDEDWTLRSAF
jgi:beta-lactamase superfamily II metal-dependent hydrolase